LVEYLVANQKVREFKPHHLLQSVTYMAANVQVITTHIATKCRDKINNSEDSSRPLPQVEDEDEELQDTIAKMREKIIEDKMSLRMSSILPQRVQPKQI
jgi:hypothetical protein